MFKCNFYVYLLLPIREMVLFSAKIVFFIDKTKQLPEF
jgi:hypothetical protein